MCCMYCWVQLLDRQLMCHTHTCGLRLLGLEPRPGPWQAPRQQVLGGLNC